MADPPSPHTGVYGGSAGVDTAGWGKVTWDANSVHLS